jgi:hypothetical protein
MRDVPMASIATTSKRQRRARRFVQAR